MTDTAMTETWKTYQAAWAPMEEERSRAQLARSVAAVGGYADTAGTAEGIDALVAYIAGFKQQFAGATFENDSLLWHHGQALATWRRINAAGEAPGRSYARFGDDGRLVHLAGFPRG